MHLRWDGADNHGWAQATCCEEGRLGPRTSPRIYFKGARSKRKGEQHPIPFTSLTSFSGGYVCIWGSPKTTILSLIKSLVQRRKSNLEHNIISPSPPVGSLTNYFMMWYPLLLHAMAMVMPGLWSQWISCCMCQRTRGTPDVLIR